MPKPEWGVKRICASCGIRFYDLLRAPVVCPGCGAEIDVTAMVKPKRIKAGVSEKTAAPVSAIDDDELIDDEDEELGDEEDLDEDLIDEDAPEITASEDDEDEESDAEDVDADDEDIEDFDDDVLLEEDEDDDIEDVAADDIDKL